jgi:glycosyltransferase involved in cell wall biosynthesis
MDTPVTPNPLISVIVPVFNGADYITEALESALAQAGASLEIIVLDDGSTDDTAKLVKNIKDPRIHYRYQPNAGVSAARNAAIKMAKGVWLAFLDCDDVWLPNKLAEQSAYFSDFDIIGGNAKVLGSDKDLLPDSEIQEFNKEGLACLVLGNRLLLSSVCLRREALSGREFSVGRRFGEDYDLWLRLMADGAKAFVMPKPVYKYRIHSASATADTISDNFEVATILRDFSLQSDIPEEIRRAARTSATHNYYAYCHVVIKNRPGFRQVLTLARQGRRYDASFVKILLFAII